MLSVIMLSVDILGVIMLNVVVPGTSCSNVFVLWCGGKIFLLFSFLAMFKQKCLRVMMKLVQIAYNNILGLNSNE